MGDESRGPEEEIRNVRWRQIMAEVNKARLTSHSSRMSSKENSLLNQMSSQRKQKQSEPLS